MSSGSASTPAATQQAAGIGPISGGHRPDTGVQAAFVSGSLVGVDNIPAGAVVDEGHGFFIGAFGSLFVAGVDGVHDPLEKGAHPRAQRRIVLASSFALAGAFRACRELAKGSGSSVRF